MYEIFLKYIYFRKVLNNVVQKNTGPSFFETEMCKFSLEGFQLRNCPHRRITVIGITRRTDKLVLSSRAGDADEFIAIVVRAKSD